MVENIELINIRVTTDSNNPIFKTKKFLLFSLKIYSWDIQKIVFMLYSSNVIVITIQSLDESVLFLKSLKFLKGLLKVYICVFLKGEQLKQCDEVDDMLKK